MDYNRYMSFERFDLQTDDPDRFAMSLQKPVTLKQTIYKVFNLESNQDWNNIEKDPIKIDITNNSQQL